MSWLLFSSIMSSMLKCHLCDFSRPIRLFLGSFLWRLLPNAHSTLPLKCFYECEDLHNRALVSVLATGRNSTNFLYKERDPCAFVNDMDNKNFSLFSNSHSKRWKGNRFLLLLYSHVCDNQKSLIGQTSFDRKLVRGKKGVLYYGTHDKSQWDKHDRKWCMRFEYTKIVKPIFLKDSSNVNFRFSNKNFEMSA